MAVLTRGLSAAVLALTLGFGGAAALADHNHKRNTVVSKLLATDGAQALVAAVLVAAPELVDVLNDKQERFTVFAPSNAAFEKLLGLKAGFLNGLSVEDIVSALPGALPPGVDAGAVAAILAKHVIIGKKRSVNRLLKKGVAKVADGSELPVSIGASGVSVNYETTIIKGDVWAGNGFIHFIDTVIVGDLLGPVPGT